MRKKYIISHDDEKYVRNKFNAKIDKMSQNASVKTIL